MLLSMAIGYLVLVPVPHLDLMPENKQLKKPGAVTSLLHLEPGTLLESA
jgi:hypothetical protein